MMSNIFDHDEVVIDSSDTIGRVGDLAANRVFGSRVTIPSFDIVQSPTIRLGEITRRRFSIIDRK
jgi:hypothetical protein